jgi:hypothetical protein
VLGHKAEPSPLPTLDRIDRYVFFWVRQGDPGVLGLVDTDTTVVDLMRKLPPAEILARVRNLVCVWNLKLAFDLDAVAGIPLDGEDARLIGRYSTEQQAGTVVPATHVLYAARDLKMDVADVATRWMKLAPLLGLEPGFEVDTLVKTTLEQRDWQLLSQNFDPGLSEHDWHASMGVAYAKIPVPLLFGSVPGLHVLHASRVLHIPATEVMARLRELAAPLRLKLQFDADALATIGLRHDDWYLLSQGGSGLWPWLSEVTAAQVVGVADHEEIEMDMNRTDSAILARLVELAAPMGLTFRPCVSFLREPALEALVNEVATRSVPIPYDGFDARRCTERWVLQAGINVNEGVEDPEHAILCAGRWWLWWLTDDALRSLGEIFMPAVIAEQGLGPVK